MWRKTSSLAPLSHIAVAALLLLPTVALPATAAGVLAWSGFVAGPAVGGGVFNRPTADGTAVADVGQVHYNVHSIYVTASGVYRLSSDQTTFEPWDGFLAVYARTFVPHRPLHNLVAAADGTGNSTTLDLPLVEGVVYRIVTATAEPVPENLDMVYRNRLAGPSLPNFSACFPVGDEIDRTDDGRTVSLLHGAYCPEIRWTTLDGQQGTARPSPLRSDSAASFWFFAPSNLEVHLKMLNGCPINGHIWLFINATTNVGVDIEMQEVRGLHRLRSYSSEPGTPFQPILDTTAFSCDDAPPVF